MAPQSAGIAVTIAALLVGLAAAIVVSAAVLDALDAWHHTLTQVEQQLGRIP